MNELRGVLRATWGLNPEQHGNKQIKTGSFIDRGALGLRLSGVGWALLVLVPQFGSSQHQACRSGPSYFPRIHILLRVYVDSESWPAEETSFTWVFTHVTY